MLLITKIQKAKSNNTSRDGSFPVRSPSLALFSTWPREVSSKATHSQAHEKGHSEAPCQSLCLGPEKLTLPERKNLAVLSLKASKQAVSSAVTLTQKPNKECLRVIVCCCPDRFLLCHLPFHVVLLQQAGSTGEKPFH